MELKKKLPLTQGKGPGEENLWAVDEQAEGRFQGGQSGKLGLSLIVIR